MTWQHGVIAQYCIISLLLQFQNQPTNEVLDGRLERTKQLFYHLFLTLLTFDSNH
jgi:hypothetical protein